MSLYTSVVSLHVIVAILGLGPLMALVMATRGPSLPAGASRPMPPEAALRVFLKLLRLSQAGLGLMLVTGGTLVAMVHGAFAGQKWLVVSVVLFVILGGVMGVAQSYFKKALKPTGAPVHVERAHLSLIATCVIVGVITWLMQTKPF
jgi:hypothetical protein